MDNLTPEQRRRNMQNIKGRGTGPERLVHSWLVEMKVRFVEQDKSLPGTPDFVFKRRKVVLFVDSDFWHGHPERATVPKTNRRFWVKKISGNVARDRRVRRRLRSMGFSVIRLWEWDIRKRPEYCRRRLARVFGLPNP